MVTAQSPRARAGRARSLWRDDIAERIVGSMRWTEGEAAEIVGLAREAPTYSAGRPWVLELHSRSVYLFEIPQRSEHDPFGFDRLLSCGAALEHIVLAVRRAGWRVQVVFPSNHDNPDLLAVVRGVRPEPPSPQELDHHRAVQLAGASGDGDAHALVHASHWAGTELRALSKTELVVLTTGDWRSDHVRGGAALQSALLAGRGAGIAVRPLVHLLHRPEWRAGLIERHGLAGFPQALAVVGAKDPVGAGPGTASAERPGS